MTNGVLLLARLLMAACFIPTALAHAANISGFSLQLWMKGMPFATAVASAVTVAEFVGPLALALGLAQRLAASVLIGTTIVTTGTLHRFWEMVPAVQPMEQAVFLGHLGLVAGLLAYAVAGPGAWSWQGWWRGRLDRPKAAKKPSRTRPSKSRPPRARDPFPEAA